MKSLRSLGLILMMMTVARAAEPVIELAAVVGTNTSLRLSLTDTAAGQTRWVAIGQQFAGYRVAGYDAPSETAVLTRDGRELRVKLKASKVQMAAATLPPEQERAILNQLRQLAAAADQYYLENGVGRTSYEALVGADKYVKQINPVAGENYRVIIFEQGKPMTVTTTGGISLTYRP